MSDLCTAGSCRRPVKGVGLCGAYYQRYRSHGDPMPDVPLRYLSRWRRGHRRRVPVHRASEHVEQLRDAGMTGAAIARHAGLSEETVRAVLYRRQRTVLKDTADALLAVVKPCEDCTSPAIAGGRWCAIGSCGYRQERRRWSWSRSAA